MGFQHTKKEKGTKLSHMWSFGQKHWKFVYSRLGL